MNLWHHESSLCRLFGLLAQYKPSLNALVWSISINDPRTLVLGVSSMLGIILSLRKARPEGQLVPYLPPCRRSPNIDLNVFPIPSPQSYKSIPSLQLVQVL